MGQHNRCPCSHSLLELYPAALSEQVRFQGSSGDAEEVVESDDADKILASVMDNNVVRRLCEVFCGDSRVSGVNDCFGGILLISGGGFVEWWLVYCGSKKQKTTFAYVMFLLHCWLL